MASGARLTERPIRVAYLDSTAEMGGAEHLLQRLLEGLPGGEVEPLLVCGEPGHFPEQCRARGIPTSVVPIPRLYSVSLRLGHRKIVNPLAVAVDLLSVLGGAFRTAHFLRSRQVDIVQTNSVFSHVYGGLAARALGLPCIWYFHDLVETRRLFGLFALCWRALITTVRPWIVGDSEAVLRGLAVGPRGVVIYATTQGANGVSSTDVRTQLKLPGEALLVGYVGRIAQTKGLDVLARAAAQVIRADPRVHFLLFGEAPVGEASFKRSMDDLVAELQLGDRWHWLGYDRQASGKMAQLDLVLLPSRREAFGLVLQEAGLAAKPVVASRVGGIPEVIVHGETGLLVAPGDAGELAAAILQVIRDPELARRMGLNARARVRSKFDPQQYFEEFGRLYQAVADGR